MQNGYINNQGQIPYSQPVKANPNAVEINIVAPQAFQQGTSPASLNNGFYSLYGQNPIPNAYYPQNYNNLINNPYNNQMQNPYYMQQIGSANNNNNGQNPSSRLSLSDNNALKEKTDVPVNGTDTKETDKTKKKKVVPLTDEYIKSIENYMNDDNPKIRLIGTKELMERFKEDENRKDNPSLMPLLNKALRDSSPSIRFLALTTLQLGYALGNDETVQILKQIQASNQDKFGEDALLASEVLLNMAQGQKVDVPMTENEIQKSQQKEKKEDKN